THRRCNHTYELVRLRHPLWQWGGPQRPDGLSQRAGHPFSTLLHPDTSSALLSGEVWLETRRPPEHGESRRYLSCAAILQCNDGGAGRVRLRATRGRSQAPGQLASNIKLSVRLALNEVGDQQTVIFDPASLQIVVTPEVLAARRHAGWAQRSRRTRPASPPGTARSG